MLRLRFEEWAAGETGTATLHFVGLAPGYRIAMPVGKDGLLRFAGLREDDVVEILVRTSLGRAWVGRGLRPSDKVRPVPGLAVSKVVGRCVGAPSGRRLWVGIRVFWGLELHSDVGPDNRFEFPGVPPGTWPVEAQTSTAGPLYRGEGEVSPGTEVEIELARR